MQMHNEPKNETRLTSPRILPNPILLAVYPSSHRIKRMCQFIRVCPEASGKAGCLVGLRCVVDFVYLPKYLILQQFLRVYFWWVSTLKVLLLQVKRVHIASALIYYLPDSLEFYSVRLLLLLKQIFYFRFSRRKNFHSMKILLLNQR